MSDEILERTQRIELPIDDAFALFGDALDLERITPPWLNFHVATSQPIEMKEGTLLDYRLRLHGVPVRWHTQITAWEPPHRFVDEQLSGPYALPCACSSAATLNESSTTGAGRCSR